MNFANEKWVKLYTRNTTNWVLLPWQSRCLFPLLLRAVDRTGCLDVGEHEIEAVSKLLDIPKDIVSVGIQGLEAKGMLHRGIQCLIISNFEQAQEAITAPALRQQNYRERKKLQKESDAALRYVTTRLEETRLDNIPPVLQADDRTTLVLNYFRSQFAVAFGKPYPVAWGKDKAALNKIPKEYSSEELMAMISAYLIDPYTAKLGASVTGFCSRMTSYLKAISVKASTPSTFVTIPSTAKDPSKGADASRYWEEVKKEMGI